VEPPQFRDEARVYPSPTYAETLKLTTPEALAGARLLVTTIQPHWEAWFGGFSQLDARTVAGIPRIHFDQALLAVEAAKLGHGVVMASPHIAEEEVASRRLIQPFGCRLLQDNGYYIVHHNKLLLGPPAMLVKQWLIEEATR
jgi:LysR family transcriptional regulator, glycine cleavage system transcriptional activator